jgi:hypothetical protein
MLDIGTKLARVSGDGAPMLGVVGVEEGTNPRYVCQPLPFGSCESFTPEELKLLYGAEDAEIRIKSEQESWRELSSRTLRKRNIERADLAEQQADLPSPEAVFAQIAAAEAKAKR